MNRTNRRQFVRFGAHDNNSCRVCLYGDVASAPEWELDECVSHPDEAGLSDHQKFSVAFGLAQPRPYGECFAAIKKVFESFKAVGWETAPQIEGVLGSGSSVDGLLEVPSLPEDRTAPAGYNAADGFTAIFEKLGTSPGFEEEEIRNILRMVAECQKEVFGTELEKQPEH